ncbi:MAG: S8 family serine peptidase, partial [Dehalococcoidia bacterium]
MNIEITLLEYAILEGDLPYDAVETVAGLDFVKHVGTPGYPIHNTGIVTSAGDSVLRADLARSTFGIDGGGSKIGVLSDGVDHLVNSIASDDLPSGVQILKGGSGDEGTAMLEIIHDLAPGADLAFYSPASSSDMIVGISALESAGCNIIVDDITFLDEPKFEDGPIAQRARQFVNDGGVYVTSAGNSRLRHYNNTYNPIYYASFDLNVHDYNLGIGQDIGNTFTIPNGYGIIAILQWNNERGTSPMDDFDFYLFNSTFNTILAGSDNDQEGGYPNPWEGFQYINDTGSTVTVNLVVTEWNLVSAPASVMLDYHVYYCPSTLQYNTTADSVIGHSAVEEVLSTAAVDAATPGTLESYSSCGPGTVYFPSYEQRQVPNITGVDGVQTRTGQLGYFSNPFYGTSAAAPHIAAIAALVWDANPTLNSSQIRNAITSTAVDLSTTGFDYYSGWGRADAYTAVDSVARKLNIFSSDGGTVTTPGIGYFGPYTYGEVVSIVATPDSCYHFLEWTGDTATIANVSSSSTTITMNDRYSITANFAAAPFSSGDGNPDNPYLIQDVCALQSIRNNLNAHYALVKDIDASATTVWNNGKGFNPIGDNISPFTGNFDGRGYTITGLHINRSTTDYVGLFGYIDSGGVVTNASLANVNITGYKHVGGLIGHINWGSVSNTYATGNVNGDSYAGGLVGYDHQSPIRNSYFLGNVRGTEDIGGLIGYLSNCLVSDSSSSGNVSGSSIIGGLVGKNQLGTVDNSYTTGHVNGTSTVGGLIGSNAGQVNKSYTTANVSATDQEAGGLIGNHLGTVRNSYATGYVSGTNIVGGLIGYNTFAGLVYYSYSTGQVSGTSASGGLIGYKASLIPVSDGFWDIETSGQSSSAGGIGKNTAEMKDFSTFLNAGWDLICESDNGTDDIWGIDQSGADNNGYPFLSWQGLTHNVSFTLAYSAGADGSINGSSLQTVNCSESGSSVEAIPDACYHFVNWSDSSTQNPRTDTSVKEDITVTANFAIDTFTLTYNAGASGSITGDTPQAVDCGSSGSAVTAVPNDCYHFVNWSDLSTDNPRTDTNVQGDITVTANFAPTGATYTLMINSSAYGNVTTPDEGSSGPYNCGDVIDLIAEADTDYAFHNWEGDVETIGNSRSSITTITMYGNYSITANFGLPPTGFYGDANRDGLLSLADYSAVQLMRFGKRPFNP